MMEKIRSQTPEEIGGFKVLAFRDYEAGTVKDMGTGKVSPSGLPRSNVLYFDLEQDGWCCARPSGTEPKIKFYVGVKGSSRKDGQEKLEKLLKAVQGLAG